MKNILKALIFKFDIFGHFRRRCTTVNKSKYNRPGTDIKNEIESEICIQRT